MSVCMTDGVKDTVSARCNRVSGGGLFINDGSVERLLILASHFEGKNQPLADEDEAAKNVSAEAARRG